MIPTSEPRSEIPFFSGLTPVEIDRVRSAGRRQKLPAGAFFFRQGDPAEAAYVLETGRVFLTQVTPEGQQVLLRVIGPGNMFGAVAVAQIEEYPVTAEAAEDCTALVWPKTVLMGLIEQMPKLALNAMRVMADHVQEFQDRFRELATQRVERRLARTLLRLASQAGKKTDEGVLIDLALTRQDLAEMTGTTLYTVSRILSQWETQGLVRSGRERVTIRFPHGLVSIAEDLG
ncbi:MAG: Crp/Fnr family transcriptional regulator [Bellilinea sp.]